MLIRCSGRAINSMLDTRLDEEIKTEAEIASALLGF